MLAADGWHPGVIGIVASRIAERHHRPAVLIALDGEEGTGSGRSIPAFDLLGGLQAASAELLRHGGHRAAAGLTIARGRVDAFRAAFVAHAAGDAARRPTWCRSSASTLSSPATRSTSAWPRSSNGSRRSGSATPSRRCSSRARCSTTRGRWGRGATSRSRLAAGGARSRCVAFGRGGSLPAAPGEPVDAAVRLELNRYNGAVEPRLVLRHARPARPAPIEVVGETGFGAALRAELERDLRSGRGSRTFDDDLRGPGDGLGRARARAVRDVRGGGIAGLLGDLVASGAPVLAVTAHAGAPRRARCATASAASR